MSEEATSNEEETPMEVDEAVIADNLETAELVSATEPESVDEPLSAELPSDNAESIAVEEPEITSTSEEKIGLDNDVEEQFIPEEVPETVPDSETEPQQASPLEDERADETASDEPSSSDQMCNSSEVADTTEANTFDDGGAKSDSVPEIENSTAINGDISETPPDVVENGDVIDNCYCGKKRNLNVVELQCSGCSKWFHEECISVPLGKCLPFMTYYTFLCKVCTPSSSESFSKKQPNFTQICATALANLTQQSISEGQPRKMFSKDREIIPYIVNNWEYLTSMQRRVKQTWHMTVYKVMMKDSDLFVTDGNSEMPSGDRSFGLANQDLTKIRPSADIGMRTTMHHKQDTIQTATGFTSGKGRSAKRRFFDGQIAAGGKKIKSDLVMPKLPPNGYPLDHPFNKDGYRYILAEPDEHAPFRKEFDESQDWAGKPIPGWLYRKLTPINVLLALHDRAPQLKISEDRLSVTGEKGYCMVRATHAVNRDTWYYEITIDDMSEGAATRLGWSQQLANLQAPLGYDKFSYSWRSRKGTKFHDSRGYHYADEGYGQGDVIGFLIHLPPTTKHIQLPPIFKDQPLVKFKSYLYYEEKEEVKQELKLIKPLPGSKIEFYKNGKSFGVAFENIYGGDYFPAASLYKNCTITFNFGPTFKFPPDVPCRAMHAAAGEQIIQQTMTDLIFFTENKGQLRLD